MTPSDMAALHARGMTLPLPWSTADFEDLLASPLVFTTGDTRAFAMGRVVADEAELLTIVTDPEQRRAGLGRACLAAFEDAASTRGARTAFLEVAATNAPAIALYRGAGWTQSGLRRAYYTTARGDRVDAIVMSKRLNPVSDAGKF